MFKKIGDVLEKLPVKLLLTIGCTCVVSIIAIMVTYSDKASVITMIAVILIVVLLAIVAVVSLTTAVTIIDNNRSEAKNKQILESLKERLSYEEFVQVCFQPYNLKSKNIQRCLKIFDDFQITHFAKIDDVDDSIIVIAKDANGKSSTPVRMDAMLFDRDYTIK